MASEGQGQPPGRGDHNSELIIYQLAELKGDLREGFAKLESRFVSVEDRLVHLERFRERVETREKAAADSSTRLDARWIPILSIFVTLTVTVVFGVLQITGNG